MAKGLLDFDDLQIEVLKAWKSRELQRLQKRYTHLLIDDSRIWIPYS